MRILYSRIFTLLTLLFFSVPAFCCTSVIISGSVRADGKPVMLKHRDTGELNNKIKWFQGAKYSFIGLVNSSSDGGEVWSGTNSAGLCIMNTATYDLKDDKVPSSEMDKEGIVMYEVLGICSTLKDFENYLNNRPKPWGVEANFGIIDAFGGAAYYEVNNHSWKRYDVADEPNGYMVVTNFTRSGRKEDRKGVERFNAATSIFSQMDIATVAHKEIFNSVSRSNSPIIRDITSASIVFEGVEKGSDPKKTVMWTILGSPTNSAYFPLMVFDRDRIPSFMNNGNKNGEHQICSESLIIKGIYGYSRGCYSSFSEVENLIDSKFYPEMSYSKYNSLMNRAYRRFRLIYRRKLPKVHL